MVPSAVDVAPTMNIVRGISKVCMVNHGLLVVAGPCSLSDFNSRHWMDETRFWPPEDGVHIFGAASQSLALVAERSLHVCQGRLAFLQSLHLRCRSLRWLGRWGVRWD
jgi:hypothetical protein